MKTYWLVTFLYKQWNIGPELTTTAQHVFSTPTECSPQEKLVVLLQRERESRKTEKGWDKRIERQYVILWAKEITKAEWQELRGVPLDTISFIQL